MTDLINLVQAAQCGNKAAFNQLVQRFQNLVYATAYSWVGDAATAQDAAQEALIDAYLSLPSLREPAAFPGWLRRVVIKHCDRQTRRKQAEMVSLDQLFDLRSLQPEPPVVVESALFQQTILALIEQLTPAQRIVTLLFYMEGYSQQEVADYLEISVTAVKKRLFNARETLKERMSAMIEQSFDHHRPSRDRVFSERVDFFVAVHSEDLPQLKRLLTRNPALVELTSNWQTDDHGYYWPGGTILHYAAGTGNRAMVELCLTHGADINQQPRGSETPLHIATQMLQPTMVDFLLARGADVNAQAFNQQTPLCLAVLCNAPTFVQKLMAAGADVMVRDRYGYTPVNWANRCGYLELLPLLDSVETTQALFPKPVTNANAIFSIPLLNAQGEPLDSNSPSAVHLMQQARPQRVASRAIDLSNHSPILPMGIKIIDLFAPLRRGGRNGFFSPLSGVGKMVTLNQLVYRMAALHDGYIVNLAMERGHYTARAMQLYWRESMVDSQLMNGRILNVFVEREKRETDALTAIKTGVALAESIRKQGHDVLLVVDVVLATYADVVTCLEQNQASNSRRTDDATTSILYWGDYTAGSEPAPFHALDTVLTLDRWRASQRLHPAIDPLRSYSQLLTPATVGEEHCAIVKAAQRLLRRYTDLRQIEENRGEDGLLQMDDSNAVHDARRARHLHHFLTQPFYGTECFTGKLGVAVTLTDAIAGCRAILDGAWDDAPEEALSYVGASPMTDGDSVAQGLQATGT